MPKDGQVILIFGDSVETGGRWVVRALKEKFGGVATQTHRVPVANLYLSQPRILRGFKRHGKDLNREAVCQEVAGEYVESLFNKLGDRRVRGVAIPRESLDVLRDKSGCPHYVVKFLFLEWPDIELYVIPPTGTDIEGIDIREALGI